MPVFKPSEKEETGSFVTEETGSFVTDKTTIPMVWSAVFIFPWEQHAACQVALDSSGLCVICQD